MRCNLIASVVDMLLPPVQIKLPISKPQYFSQQIQDRVKHQVEKNEPEQMIGQLKTQRRNSK